MKKIRVMFDFCSSGLWNMDDVKHGGMIEYEDLKLPKDLVKDMEAWIYSSDRCHSQKTFRLLAKNVNKVHKAGIALAKRIKALHKDKKITYWGEGKNGKMIKEIEIT